MATTLQPWQILVAAFAGWISRHQDAVIEYRREENRVLKQQLGRRRLRVTDAVADVQVEPHAATTSDLRVWVSLLGQRIAGQDHPNHSER